MQVVVEQGYCGLLKAALAVNQLLGLPHINTCAQAVDRLLAAATQAAPGECRWLANRATVVVRKGAPVVDQLLRPPHKQHLESAL